MAHLCLQARLARLRKAPEIAGLHHVSLSVEQGDNATRRLAPARLDRGPVHRLGIHAKHDPVERDKQRSRVLVNLLFRPQVRQEITGAVLEAAPRLGGQLYQGTRRRTQPAEPDPGIRALARTQVGHEIKRQARSRRRQAALGQAEDALGREHRRAPARRAVARAVVADRSEHRHRMAPCGIDLSAGPAVDFQGVPMIVNPLEGIAEDRAGEVMDHVAKHKLGLQWVLHEHRRNIIRHPTGGVGPDHVIHGLPQAVTCRLNDVIVSGEDGVGKGRFSL